MNFGIIFLAGVHGVGKGHLASKLPLPNFSASALIREQKQRPVDHNKIVIGAQENQDFLISALDRLRLDAEPILLDGHFILRSNTGVFNVPIATFQSMNLVAIVQLTAAPELIHSRLMERDGMAANVAEIDELQKLEIARAREISAQLNRPLLVVGQDRHKEVWAWLSQLLLKAQ